VSTTTPDVPTQLTHTTLHKLGLADSLQKVAFQMLQPFPNCLFFALLGIWSIVISLAVGVRQVTNLTHRHIVLHSHSISSMLSNSTKNSLSLSMSIQHIPIFQCPTQPSSYVEFFSSSQLQCGQVVPWYSLAFLSLLEEQWLCKSHYH